MHSNFVRLCKVCYKSTELLIITNPNQGSWKHVTVFWHHIILSFHISHKTHCHLQQVGVHITSTEYYKEGILSFILKNIYDCISWYLIASKRCHAQHPRSSFQFLNFFGPKHTRIWYYTSTRVNTCSYSSVALFTVYKVHEVTGLTRWKVRDGEEIYIYFSWTWSTQGPGSSFEPCVVAHLF